jgi:hypothetical protein
MVGAVGIENNNVRNFKDLRGILGNGKSLRRNNKARKGILIAPSKLPRFSLSLRFLLSTSSSTACNKCRLRAQDSRHGWQAGKLYILSFASLRGTACQRLTRHFQEHQVAFRAVRNA